MTGFTVTVVVSATLLYVSAARAVVFDTQKCEAAKLRAVSKYSACRLLAERKALLKGAAADFSQCDSNFANAWGKAEARYGSACPSSGDQSQVQTAITDDTDDLRSHLDGGVLEGGAQPLQTGQTQCDQGAGTLGPCPGSPAGQDGAVSSGAVRQYVDNGNGTITDTKTGLMWEKLSRDGSIHDSAIVYSWYAAFTTKIAGLNGGSGFAGYTDWRLPNRFELETLAHLGRLNPCIDPAFNTACAPSCTVLTCSCTQSSSYWTSTTYLVSPSNAWLVLFADATVLTGAKTTGFGVRAVRGGS